MITISVSSYSGDIAPLLLEEVDEDVAVDVDGVFAFFLDFLVSAEAAGPLDALLFLWTFAEVPCSADSSFFPHHLRVFGANFFAVRYTSRSSY
jgi:hypothetical protein